MSARVDRGVTASTSIPLPPHLEWMAKARCLRKGIQTFYVSGRPTSKEYARLLKQWCLKCPVRPECLSTCLRQELKAKHTSRGIQGATPSERTTLRRRIRESGICVTEGVRRWLHDMSIPRPPTPTNQRYRIALLGKSGVLVYEHTATKTKGAHLIAAREQRRQGTWLVGVIYCQEGHVIEILPAVGQGKPVTTLCPC